MVDMTAKRYVLHLGATDVQNYSVGESSMQFAASAIDTAGLKKSWLNNVGLLLVLAPISQDRLFDLLLEVSVQICISCDTSKCLPTYVHLMTHKQGLLLLIKHFSAGLMLLCR